MNAVRAKVQIRTVAVVVVIGVFIQPIVAAQTIEYFRRRVARPYINNRHVAITRVEFENPLGFTFDMPSLFECDDQTIGKTRIISNQLGYPDGYGGFECKDFDRTGLPVEIAV